MCAVNDSPSGEEVQGRQCHGRAVNFGHGRLGSRNALDLFKVGAKQLANFNVVKQDGIFGAHVKPENFFLKDNRQIHVVQFCIHWQWRARARKYTRHTKIYLPTPASPPLMDVELSNW